MKHELNPKQIGEWFRVNTKKLWAVFTRRLWLKIASLLIAIFVWNAVVAGDSSITRSKTLFNVKGSVTGQATLSTYGLALLTDPEALLGNFTVQLDVAQSQYSYATAENVSVSLDLSGVRTAGTQDVPLTAVSAYGRVLSITPQTVNLTFEALDSRSIPVNVEFDGDIRDDIWYNVSRINPMNITVSGASSLVRRIVQARVYTDVSDEESGYTRAEPYVLLDSDGNEINPSMLARSSTSVTVVTEQLPMKEIPISTNIADVVTGYPADGYEVAEVSVRPETIVIAAEKDLLDSITELQIEPVSVEGASQSFTGRAKISLLSDFKYASAEEVYVNVIIEEETFEECVNIAAVELSGLEDGYSAQYDLDGQRAWIKGGLDVLNEHLRSGIILQADVTGLEPGVHNCKLTYDPVRYPEMEVTPENETIEITLTANE